ncbi:MAG: TonB-dependent receptor [Cellulophaga sp.]
MKIKLILPNPKGQIFLRFIMRMFILLCCTTVLSFAPKNVIGQNSTVTIDADKIVTIDEIFEIIKLQTEYKFLYKTGLFDNAPKAQLKKGKIKTSKLLRENLSSKIYRFELQENNTIIVSKKIVSVPPEDLIKVTGRVTDEADLPLVGVTVRISGTNKGTTTDFSGKYSIMVDSIESVLVFSSLGFATKEIIVGNQTVLNVIMQEAVSELDEVVLNAGYYKVPKREATGSISRVDAKAIAKQPVSNPLATLHARMPGVQIIQSSGIAGGGFKIKIRGRNSLRREGNDPLVIIDGMPFSTQSANSNFVSGNLFSPSQGASPLNSINPADIESIEVLKDADATAIYGSRGANGVVLITTKKGKAGKTTLDVNMYSGFSAVTNTMDLMNTEQYLEMRREAYALDNRTISGSSVRDLLLWDQNRYTDWQEELIGGTAYTNNIQTSLSGGNENTQFLFSGGYYNETTVFPGDFDYQKISSHLKINHQSSNNKFKFNGSVSYVADKNNNVGADFTRTALSLSPNAPALYDDAGNLNWENFNENPFRLLEQTYLGKTKNLISNVGLEYELVKGLTLKTNLGYNTVNFDESILIPSTLLNPAFGRGSEFSSIKLNNTARASWIIEPQLSWKKAFGKGVLDLLVGATFQESTSESLVIRGSGFPDNSLITNIKAASNILILDGSNSMYRYTAFFGRINYKYDGKYILNITGRRDGSSRFGTGKQFADFVAVGAAWLFSEENLFKDSTFLSFGKLRASYGSTGSDQIGDYRYLDSYSLSDANYDGITTLFPTQLFNANFAWEVNKKLEFALDLGLWNDRVLLNTAYYHNRSSNQLVGLPLSRLTGFTSIISNFPATVQNTGFEFELNTINIQKGDFTWKSGFNITIPKNKLIAFPNLEQSDVYRNSLVIGEPINIRKVYEYSGVDPETGVYTFTDFNDDGAINSDDQQIIKSLDPEYYGGIFSDFTYKGFQFDFLFQFVKQEGSNYVPSGVNPGTRNNLPITFFQNRWQVPADRATIQRYTTGRNRDARTGLRNYSFSNRAITDASFMRLKNVSLSYTLSEEWTKGFKTKLYLQGQNLLTITDYFGLDPETLNSILPTLKTITLGAQFTF